MLRPVADDNQLPERIVRELISLQAETAGVDFKRSFDGSKRAKGDLVKCIMAFANSKDGGYIIFGVGENEGKFVAAGISDSEIAALDITRIADLARRYCTVLPEFTVHRVELDGKMLVMVSVVEIDVGPVICTTNLHDENNQLVLRQAAMYTRNQAACDELMSAEEMTNMVHRAASKYATDLMRQVQDLAGRGGAVTPVERPQFDDGVSARGAVLPDFYVQDLTDAAAFFAANGSYEPGWYVELRPTNFDPQRVSDRAGLRRLEKTRSWASEDGISLTSTKRRCHLREACNQIPLGVPTLKVTESTTPDYLCGARDMLVTSRTSLGATEIRTV